MEKYNLKAEQNQDVTKGVKLTMKDSPALAHLLDVIAIIIAHDYTYTVRHNPAEFTDKGVKP